MERSGANYIARVRDGEPVNRHRPSVEVLFQSAARVVGPNSLGVMLTGMGADGAKAMRELRDAGSWNVAQDEASCVVFGMPKEAIAAGAVHEILPLQAIAGRPHRTPAQYPHRSASPASERSTMNTDIDIDAGFDPDAEGFFEGDLEPKAIPLLVAAELQDDLLAATNDLERLQTLLSDACDTLLVGFSAAAASQAEGKGASAGPEDALVRQRLAEAVTAMQFQDMASQLIAHTHLRLSRCSNRIAQHAFHSAEDGEDLELPPLRPNPVTQDEMDAGSIELF